jgi:hypothetical protein
LNKSRTRFGISIPFSVLKYVLFDSQQQTNDNELFDDMQEYNITTTITIVHAAVIFSWLASGPIKQGVTPDMAVVCERV